MNAITEAARTVEVVHETDVLVVGSGPGAFSAALAAARAGARTTLLDRYGCFGGNMTQVGVESIGWYRHEGTVEANGIGRELEERSAAMGAASPESQSLTMGIDGERFKYVADVLVEEADIAPMLHRLAVAPIVEDGLVRGVITESKSGREAVLAKRIVDATGDADVAARAGAPFQVTPREEMLAASVMFSMTGVNKPQVPGGGQGGPADVSRLGGQRGMGHRDDGQGGRAVLAVPPQAVQARRRRGPHPEEPDHARRDVGNGHRTGRPHVPQPDPSRPASTAPAPTI